MSASINPLTSSSMPIESGTTPKPRPLRMKQGGKKPSWAKSKPNTKVRMKLPPIESYQKELEFQAEAPARVIVRLERLMGTDKIRITDPKYMSLLLERIQKEEEAAWVKRTRDRKQAERNRFRQLAVEGLMDPTPDMVDLYNHPVFRVNRILNRLTKLDSDIGVNSALKLPPIIPVEPFAGDSISYSSEGYQETQHQQHVHKEEEECSTVDPTKEEKHKDPSSSSRKKSVHHYEDEDREEEEHEEWAGESQEFTPLGKDRNRSNTMAGFMKTYGIPMSAQIEKKCKPYRSPLIGLVYDDDLGGAKEMYDMANNILGAYKRENMVADDFTVKLGKML